MALQAIVRWLLPREDHFFSHLEKQAVIAHEAAQVLASSRTADVKEVRTKVQELEHDGDKIVHEMEEALSKTFVTPIDREDLQRLSSELDTVLDLTNGAARACDLFGVTKPTEPMLALMGVLVECTQVIVGALPKLRLHQYQELIEDSRTLKKLEKDGDAIFREAVSGLFKDPNVDAKVLLREKAVLEDLENAVDHCDQLAGTLAQLAVKHG
jgi:predicted phosphate transport protein (TIGR00153 family)